eukprot:GHVH01004459.1.p1 GENE.GHVH01004459.1~~GHVH01004459.1.p1  ORF type:complete len:826 (+),score=130.94 GHVH01004459.1:243-2720(+)
MSDADQCDEFGGFVDDLGQYNWNSYIWDPNWDMWFDPKVNKWRDAEKLEIVDDDNVQAEILNEGSQPVHPATLSYQSNHHRRHKKKTMNLPVDEKLTDDEPTPPPPSSGGPCIEMKATIPKIQRRQYPKPRDPYLDTNQNKPIDMEIYIMPPPHPLMTQGPHIAAQILSDKHKRPFFVPESYHPSSFQPIGHNNLNHSVIGSGIHPTDKPYYQTECSPNGETHCQRNIVEVKLHPDIQKQLGIGENQNDAGSPHMNRVPGNVERFSRAPESEFRVCSGPQAPLKKRGIDGSPQTTAPNSPTNHNTAITSQGLYKGVYAINGQLYSGSAVEDGRTTKEAVPRSKSSSSRGENRTKLAAEGHFVERKMKDEIADLDAAAAGACSTEIEERGHTMSKQKVIIRNLSELLGSVEHYSDNTSVNKVLAQTLRTTLSRVLAVENELYSEDKKSIDRLNGVDDDDVDINMDELVATADEILHSRLLIDNQLAVGRRILWEAASSGLRLHNSIHLLLSELSEQLSDNEIVQDTIIAARTELLSYQTDIDNLNTCRNDIDISIDGAWRSSHNPSNCLCRPARKLLQEDSSHLLEINDEQEKDISTLRTECLRRALEGAKLRAEIDILRRGQDNDETVLLKREIEALTREGHQMQRHIECLTQDLEMSGKAFLAQATPIARHSDYGPVHRVFERAIQSTDDTVGLLASASPQMRKVVQDKQQEIDVLKRKVAEISATGPGMGSALANLRKTGNEVEDFLTRIRIGAERGIHQGEVDRTQSIERETTMPLASKIEDPQLRRQAEGFADDIAALRDIRRKSNQLPSSFLLYSNNNDS